VRWDPRNDEHCRFLALQNHCPAADHGTGFGTTCNETKMESERQTVGALGPYNRFNRHRQPIFQTW
jgi:hypothetical protein